MNKSAIIVGAFLLFISFQAQSEYLGMIAVGFLVYGLTKHGE